MRVSFTLYGISFDAVVSYTPGTPDVWYLPNGDPGYPGDPAELEIHELTVDDKDASFMLDSRFEQDIYDAAQVAAASDLLDQARDAQAERLIERYLDREYV